MLANKEKSIRRYLKPTISLLALPLAFVAQGNAGNKQFLIYSCFTNDFKLIESASNHPISYQPLIGGSQSVSLHKKAFIVRGHSCQLVGHSHAYCHVTCSKTPRITNIRYKDVYYYNVLIKLNQTKSKDELINITFNLIKSELSKCCGALPIEPTTGKLIANLLTEEQLEILAKHRPLMREAIKHYKVK